MVRHLQNTRFSQEVDPFDISLSVYKNTERVQIVVFILDLRDPGYHDSRKNVNKCCIFAPPKMTQNQLRAPSGAEIEQKLSDFDADNVDYLISRIDGHKPGPESYYPIFSLLYLFHFFRNKKE